MAGCNLQSLLKGRQFIGDHLPDWMLQGLTGRCGLFSRWNEESTPWRRFGIHLASISIVRDLAQYNF